MTNNQTNFEIIITGKSMARRISELLQRRKIPHMLLSKCKGISLKFNLLEYLGFVEVKKTILLFQCDELIKKVILKFILKYFNKKNNGIMFSVRGDRKMKLENSMFIAIVNAGKAEKITDLIRQTCQAGSTIIDGRGSGANATKFMGVEIDSNKEIVLSVMPNKQIRLIKKTIKKEFAMESTDIVSFSVPIDDFNKLHQEKPITNEIPQV